jgi:glutamate-1-semialdehyde 2,1-aminomutase
LTVTSPAAPAAASASRPLSFDKSVEAIRTNSQWISGGVNSNFRLNISPTPLVFERGEGAYLYDVDGNRLIDYYLGMGPMILGHKPQALVDAVKSQIDNGILFAGQTAIEAEAARLVCELVPSAERMRFGSSGSEVDQAAMRLARAATGRTKILKFEGHYHGWFDNVLWSTAPALDAAGPADAPTPVIGSKGQLKDTADTLVVLPWNNLELLEARLAQGDIAAVIMEAAMCNQGAVHPLAGYLEGVREACTRTGTILIFDEVITGFRLAPGGAQELFGVTPDLSTFGKAIANGFPVAAIAGRADLMDMFTSGGVVHGGTYNAQPIAMAATAATLKSLTPALYKKIGVFRHGAAGRLQGDLRLGRRHRFGGRLPAGLPRRAGPRQAGPRFPRSRQDEPPRLHRAHHRPDVSRRPRPRTRRLVPLQRARCRGDQRHPGCDA